jgi:hypothetical protein
MHIDENSFPQNMVVVVLPKGKTRVLTSEKAKAARIVNPKLQMTAEDYREVKRRCNRQKSRLEQAEFSKMGAMRRRPTS